LARELNCNRPRLLELRHAIHDNAIRGKDDTTLADAVVEVDEMYQNAGEKRCSTLGSGRPAATPRQPRQGARHMGQRSPAGVRDGRTRKRPGSHGSSASK
jgi:hypothetical protein